MVLLHQLLDRILMKAGKPTLSLMLKINGLKSNMKMLIPKPRRLPWVLHIMVGILGFSLKFLLPSVVRALSQLLSWLMGNLLHLVSLSCSLPMEKVGNILGNGKSLIDDYLTLMLQKTQRTFWDLHLNSII